MRIKVYKVWVKDRPDIWYYVDAPSKRIAKWSGANLANNEYTSFLTNKDIEAEKFTYEEN